MGIGVSFAHGYVVPCAAAGGGPGLLDGFARWDGRSYAAILAHGYQCDAGARSRIAFFPLYPLLGKAVGAFTGWSPMACLMTVSLVSFGFTLSVLAEYAAQRDVAVAPWAVLATACLPAGFFFRMAYTESTCLLLLVATALVIVKRKPMWLAAALAGACSGTRSVGVAAAVAVLLYAVRNRPSRKSALARGPVAARVVVGRHRLLRISRVWASPRMVGAAKDSRRAVRWSAHGKAEVHA